MGASVNRFEIGLSLSGAISAGAYSAGVLDFLLQALDEWEAAKAAGAADQSIGIHSVGIKVMAGASAGAITAAVGAIALAFDPESSDFPAAVVKPGGQRLKYKFRRLYESWVVRPALVADQAGDTDLLSLSDLEGANSAREVRSILNAELLDEIASAALAPRGVQMMPRTYVAERLHLYITMSNLRGTPYAVQFKGGLYGMMQHGDRAHYVIEGLGDWPSQSAFADSDSVTCLAADRAANSGALQASTLFGQPGLTPRWRDYTQAALASAAFPVGLAPRQVGTDFDAYRRRNWPVSNWPDLAHVAPYFPASFQESHAAGFSFGAVDGGVIDNDPFEYALYTLFDDPAKEETALDKADKGIIMIAPFPEPPSFPPDGLPALDIISVYLALMPALQNQVRFKPSALALAADDAVGSRYMISPKRQVCAPGTDEPVDATYPIASGLLSGFGGFVARPFRDHDFQLGRRNCQRFLSEVFRLAATNASIGGKPDRREEELLPVIPLCGSARGEVAQPPWPQITEADLDRLIRRIAIRLRKVSWRILGAHARLALVRWLIWPVLGLVDRDVLKRMILSDLVRRGQIREWTVPAEWCGAGVPAIVEALSVQAVLAELVRPGFDLRSRKGLAAACHLDLPAVDRILARCVAAEARPFQVWKSPWQAADTDDPLFCLMSRRPGWVKRQLGLRHAGMFLSKARTDPPAPPMPQPAPAAP